MHTLNSDENIKDISLTFDCSRTSCKYGQVIKNYVYYDEPYTIPNETILVDNINI